MDHKHVGEGLFKFLVKEVISVRLAVFVLIFVNGLFIAFVVGINKPPVFLAHVVMRAGVFYKLLSGGLVRFFGVVFRVQSGVSVFIKQIAGFKSVVVDVLVLIVFIGGVERVVIVKLCRKPAVGQSRPILLRSAYYTGLGVGRRSAARPVVGRIDEIDAVVGNVEKFKVSVFEKLRIFLGRGFFILVIGFVWLACRRKTR